MIVEMILTLLILLGFAFFFGYTIGNTNWECSKETIVGKHERPTTLNPFNICQINDCEQKGVYSGMIGDKHVYICETHTLCINCPHIIEVLK